MTISSEGDMMKVSLIVVKPEFEGRGIFPRVLEMLGAHVRSCISSVKTPKRKREAAAAAAAADPDAKSDFVGRRDQHMELGINTHIEAPLRVLKSMAKVPEGQHAHFKHLGKGLKGGMSGKKVREEQFSVNTQSYSEATSVVAAATNSASVLLPFRYSSLKSIILGHYQQNNARAYARMFTSRSRCNLESYYFRIGNAHVPATPIELGGINDLPASAMTELLKCFHVGIGVVQFGCNLDKSSYNLNGGRTEMGKFLIGLEMESFQAGSSNRVEAGTNTLASQVFAELRYSGAGTPHAQDINAWAFHDVLLTCTAGVCRATV